MFLLFPWWLEIPLLTSARWSGWIYCQSNPSSRANKESSEDDRMSSVTLQVVLIGSECHLYNGFTGEFSGSGFRIAAVTREFSRWLWGGGRDLLGRFPGSVQVDWGGLKWIEVDWDGLRWIEVDWGGLRWIKVDLGGLKVDEMVKVDEKGWI